MNITESNDLNTLLGWIFGSDTSAAAAERAREAAARLADRANKALSAGWTGARTRAAWQELVWDVYVPATPQGQASVRACRQCGCTDEAACPGCCSWVAADLCSACDDMAPGAPTTGRSPRRDDATSAQQ